MVSLKMKATASNKGFTLVELIVVITILAILGTIGFISLQGYSGQSRDTKRTTDLRTLVTAVTTKSTEGIALSAFVANPTSAALNLPGAAVAGANSLVTDYFAGIPNYQVFAIDPNSFKDGLNDYRMAVSTKAGGVYQFATSLERALPSGRSGFVTGTYNPRNTLAATSASIPVLSVNVANDTIALPTADINKFKVGDAIIVASGFTTMSPVVFTVQSISSDGTTLKMNQDITLAPTTAGTLGLGTVAGTVVSEVTGLIRDTTPTTPVPVITG